MKLKAVVEKGAENQAKPHPLYDRMNEYGWLIIKLVPLFGSDRVALAEMGKDLGICVHNRKSGEEIKQHAMWIERGKFSLNALPEEKRDTVVRHFIQDCKYALWGTV